MEKTFSIVCLSPFTIVMRKHEKNFIWGWRKHENGWLFLKGPPCDVDDDVNGSDASVE